MLRNFFESLQLRFVILPTIRRRYSGLSLRETFQTIYRTKAWGDDGTPFCSGGGSRGENCARYCDLCLKIIRENGVRSVVDLGCGDFFVGRHIVEATGIRYTGIDVVPELIEFHKQTFQNEHTGFQCADITKDALPAADLCLIRQVLQHLSNQEILNALDNLKCYRRILISEDVPVRPRSFNLDKQHGPDVRAYYGSGVYIDKAPFSLPISAEWSFPLSDSNLLRVVLIDTYGDG